MRCLHWILPLVSILYFINRRTDSEKLRKLEKRMREPEPEQDFKPQLELLRTLMSRVTTDVQQIEILTNYLEDKLVKKRNASIKRTKFTTLSSEKVPVRETFCGTNSSSVIENINKNHNQPEQDIKLQLELLRTLMPSGDCGCPANLHNHELFGGQTVQGKGHLLKE